MAGKDSEGMSPVDESIQHVEESPDINRNPESREKDKPLRKKAEVSRAKREKASQPSSSKTTSVVKSDFCLLYTSPSPRDLSTSRMPSSA